MDNLMNKMLSVGSDTLDEFAGGETNEMKSDKAKKAEKDKKEKEQKAKKAEKEKALKIKKAEKEKADKAKKDKAKKEGKIPSDKDSEATKIKKLTEEDDEYISYDSFLEPSSELDNIARDLKAIGRELIKNQSTKSLSKLNKYIKWLQEIEKDASESNFRSYATKIKKLTEEDDEVLDDMPEELPDDSGMPPEPADDEADDMDTSGPDEGKEYFGSKEDTYYYIEKEGNEGDQLSDIRIVDQEGDEVFSATKAEVDPNDIVATIVQAIQDVDIVDISYNIFTDYIIPALIEEEEEVLPDEELEELPPDEELDEIPEESVNTNIVVDDKTIEVVCAENVVTVGDSKYKFTEAFMATYKVEGKVTEAKLKELAQAILAQKNRKNSK